MYICNYKNYSIFKSKHGYYYTDFCNGHFDSVREIKEEIDGGYIL